MTGELLLVTPSAQAVRPQPYIPQQSLPVGAIEIDHRARRIGRRRDRELGEFELRLLLQIDGASGFAVPERQLRAEFVGKRPHRLVLRAGGDPQRL